VQGFSPFPGVPGPVTFHPRRPNSPVSHRNIPRGSPSTFLQESRRIITVSSLYCSFISETSTGGYIGKLVSGRRGFRRKNVVLGNRHGKWREGGELPNSPLLFLSSSDQARRGRRRAKGEHAVSHLSGRGGDRSGLGRLKSRQKSEGSSPPHFLAVADPAS
jgi:hypothetical protein